jgi:hypothetical protein
MGLLKSYKLLFADEISGILFEKGDKSELDTFYWEQEKTATAVVGAYYYACLQK